VDRRFVQRDSGGVFGKLLGLVLLKNYYMQVIVVLQTGRRAGIMPQAERLSRLADGHSEHFMPQAALRSPFCCYEALGTLDALGILIVPPLGAIVTVAPSRVAMS